jgi:hypothetical protein
MADDMLGRRLGGGYARAEPLLKRARLVPCNRIAADAHRTVANLPTFTGWGGRADGPDYSPDMARDSLMRELSGIVLGQVRDALQKRSSTQLGAPADEPPVVAQLMIEIRSDGSRTIARGALNDLRSGESAQVHAEGKTPSDLILSLTSSLLALPASFSQKIFRKTTGSSDVKVELKKGVSNAELPRQDSTGAKGPDGVDRG